VSKNVVDLLVRISVRAGGYVAELRSKELEAKPKRSFIRIIARMMESHERGRT
jgi:hypothetical protein